MANPYEGLGIFQPTDQNAAIEQHAKDMEVAQAAFTRVMRVNDFASGQWQEDEIVLARIGKGVPPVDSAIQDVFAKERDTAQTLVTQVIPGYVGAIHGWAAYIQVLRAIEARKPGTITPDRLVLPAMPQVLADYAAANGL